jgi:trypsin-like peptidase
VRLRLFLTALILSFIVTLIAAPLSLPVSRDYESGMVKSFSSSCIVERNATDGLGSGILLDTGYILTAAHVIDFDQSGKLRPEQRLRTIRMLGETHEATVAYIDTKNDFAFLKPIKAIRHKGAIVSKQRHRLGDKVYAIGATDGHPLNISPGLILTPGVNGHARASCYISVGNSGGGIFDSKDEMVGIVSMVGITQSRIGMSLTMPMPTEDGYELVRVFGTTIFHEKVKNNCLFVPSELIRSELRKKSASSLLDAPREQTVLEIATTPAARDLVRCAVSLAIFLWVVYCVRKHLFGK